MAAQLNALTFDANDPRRLARFWAGVLGWEIADDPDDGVALLPSDDTGFRIRFLRAREQKTEQNQMHFDLTSTLARGPAADGGEGARSSAPGTSTSGSARRRSTWCSPTPRATSSASSSRATASSPTAASSGRWPATGRRQVGYFWSEALGWPLVWDQDEETAIRSPHGGPKITWGGPPLKPKTGKNRLHFDIAPPADGDQQAEVDRLVSLGATRDRHRPGRRRLGGDGRSGRQRVLRA